MMKRQHFILFGIILAADQATKAWILNNAQTLPVSLSDYFSLVLLWNPGVVFGLSLFSQPWAYILLTSAICLAVLYTFHRSESRRERYALVVVLAGAVGNIIDRIRFKAVLDFIDIHVQGHHWPAFNLADLAISCSMIYLSYLFLRKPL